MDNLATGLQQGCSKLVTLVWAMLCNASDVGICTVEIKSIPAFQHNIACHIVNQALFHYYAVTISANSEI